MIIIGLWPIDEVAGTCCQGAFVRKTQGLEREQHQDERGEPSACSVSQLTKRPRGLRCSEAYPSEQERRPKGKYCGVR